MLVILGMVWYGMVCGVVYMRGSSHPTRRLDAAQDQFMEYAQHEPGKVASYDQTSYSAKIAKGYFPCRYNKIGA